MDKYGDLKNVVLTVVPYFGIAAAEAPLMIMMMIGLNPGPRAAL